MVQRWGRWGRLGCGHNFANDRVTDQRCCHCFPGVPTARSCETNPTYPTCPTLGEFVYSRFTPLLEGLPDMVRNHREVTRKWVQLVAHDAVTVGEARAPCERGFERVPGTCSKKSPTGTLTSRQAGRSSQWWASGRSRVPSLAILLTLKFHGVTTEGLERRFSSA